MDRELNRPALSRRRALRLALGAAAGAAVLPLLNACGSAGTSASPTAVPAKPAAETKPTEAAKPAADAKPTEAAKPAQAAPAAQSKVSEVNVAALFPLSGDLARPGETCLNAAKLGADDINEAGGIKALGGAKINLVSSDLRSDDKVTRTETERVLTGQKITAVNGCYASALSLVASEVTEREKVPIVTGSITNPLIERGFKYIFQVAPRASQFGEAQVKLAQEVAGDQRRVAVVYENTAYGSTTSKGVQDEAQKQGLEVTLFEAYEKSFTDAGPLVNKIKAGNPGVLFPISYPNDFALIVRTLKQQNVKVPIIAGGAGPLFPEFGKNFGEDANGILSIGSWSKDLNQDTLEIDKRYRARHGEFIQEHAGEVYVFMWLIADAIERAGSAEPEAVRNALVQTNLTTGFGAAMPNGKVQFDERGWNSGAFPVGVQWQGGDLVTVYPKDVAKTPIVKPV
jgi:branched-chain amino acid transport system substrate-binding protein